MSGPHPRILHAPSGAGGRANQLVDIHFLRNSEGLVKVQIVKFKRTPVTRCCCCNINYVNRSGFVMICKCSCVPVHVWRGAVSCQLFFDIGSCTKAELGVYCMWWRVLKGCAVVVFLLANIITEVKTDSIADVGLRG